MRARRFAWIALFLLATCTVTAWAQREAKSMSADDFIFYRRSGGFVGTDDRITIWPDGMVQIGGKRIPNRTLRLSSRQLQALRDSFDGWETLRGQYRAQASDDFLIELCFQGKMVSASELAMPEPFARARRAIEALAEPPAASQPATPQDQ